MFSQSFCQKSANSPFAKLSKPEAEPFSYRFRDAWAGSGDSNIQAMLARCRMLFAKEPNVNGRQKKVLSALATFGW